ncbi:26S proteasome regulatory subunit S2 [Tieghemostelium lacteum]|uniref:26S proteasome regulatory subunit S2 n=1 Tax=Tieghemostelium lacteum TaxID=361077 RepID=A0A151ZAM9_TIELA|nr:26S proteasome regulatory subunit S2 [Tieghemostelium lacteum]|eukprot:KYQ90991.1 26S proteasome regulatory subunit S2 [Tieghemostelium lacteum]
MPDKEANKTTSVQNNNNNNEPKKENIKKKQEKKEEVLSAEDEKLKNDLELLVERVKDTNAELVKAALNSLKTEIKSSTSSMTSVPKPLKFLRPHYKTLEEAFSKFQEGPNKKSLADVLSVLAMANGNEDRNTLKYNLLGSSGESIASWGHEYVRHLAKEIGEEYDSRQNDKKSCDDLLKLVDEIIPFQMSHNAEPDACDLLLEVEQLPKIYRFIDENNYHRVCLYLFKCSYYVPGPEDVQILKVCVEIYLKQKHYTDALSVALKLDDQELITSIFSMVPKDQEETLKQLAFIAARQKIVPQNYDGTDKYSEIFNNSKLTEYFLNLATDLDIREPKLPEDIFQSHLDNTNNSGIDSARLNLASSFVNAFVNAGFGRDKLMVTEEDTKWWYKNKDLGIMSTVASTGMILLWDIEAGLTKIDKYLYNSDRNCKNGALLAIGMIGSGIKSDMDPSLALLTEYTSNNPTSTRIAAIYGLGLAYAGTRRQELFELLSPFLSEEKEKMEFIGIVALSLGLIFVGSCDSALSELFIQTLMERGTQAADTHARFMHLALGLLYLGKQDQAEVTLETLLAIEGKGGEYARLTLEACAYAGTGNVLKVQNMLHFCCDGQDNAHHGLAVLSISLIAMGEDLGPDMCLRMFDHLLQKGNIHIKRAIPLALALLSPSNPRIAIMDILSKLSHDNDIDVAQGAILALGIIGAGTNNARIGAMLRALAVFYDKNIAIFYVRIAQGLLHMGKGTLTINPYHMDRTLMSPVGVAGLLTLLHAALDQKGILTGPSHYLFYSLVSAMNPRMLMTLDENLQPLPISVRVGQSVDTVGLAGKPKTITGFQTHTTPVLLGYNERAELATDDYIALTNVLEGIVILKPNPNASTSPITTTTSVKK